MVRPFSLPGGTGELIQFFLLFEESYMRNGNHFYKMHLFTVIIGNRLCRCLQTGINAVLGYARIKLAISRVDEGGQTSVGDSPNGCSERRSQKPTSPLKKKFEHNFSFVVCICTNLRKRLCRCRRRKTDQCPVMFRV
jgi:hypothetical protein